MNDFFRAYYALRNRARREGRLDAPTYVNLDKRPAWEAGYEAALRDQARDLMAEISPGEPLEDRVRRLEEVLLGER